MAPVKLTDQSVLVVDDNMHHLAIVGEILRAAGFTRVATARDSLEAIQALKFGAPQIVILDWAIQPIDGLGLTRMIRHGELGGDRTVPIVMLTARSTKADVEAARLAGVHEYAIKPVSSATLLQRIEAAATRPRRFVDSPVYVGPCRRRQNPNNYDGPLRRLADPSHEENKDRINQGVARIAALTQSFDAADRGQVRAVYASARATMKTAEELNDEAVGRSAGSLARYIEAFGASGRIESIVVKTHVEALNHLIVLPDAAVDARTAVADGLERIVEKKLRQSSAA